MRRLTRAAVLCAGLMIAPAANAAQWLLTFNGSVLYQLSQTHFLADGLAGKAVKVTVEVDDAAYDPFFSQFTSALESYGVPSGLGATVELDGLPYEVARLGDNQSGGVLFQANNAPSTDGIVNNTYIDIASYVDLDQPGDFGVFTKSYGLRLSAYTLGQLFGSNDFRVPGTYATGSNAISYGDLTYTAQYVDDERPSLTHQSTDYVQFSLTSYTVARAGSSGPSVPEPASWAMMILGFGTIGAAARRRRALAA